jgi:hypothetical protein
MQCTVVERKRPPLAFQKEGNRPPLAPPKEGDKNMVI